MANNYLTYRDAVYVTTAETLEYVIKRGDDEIFRGLARKAPGAEYVYIPVGEICRGYLQNNLPSNFDELNDYIMKQLDAWASFVLYSVDHTLIWNGPDTYLDDVTEQAEGIYNFLLNWEYVGPSWDGERRVLSDPINGRIDPRMRFVYTEFNLVNCNCFCVTPLLSSPSSGCTCQSKLVLSDEFDDPSKIELVVDSNLVTVSDVSLTGVTFIVAPNSGYNQEIRVEYWYDGEYKAVTVIAAAGDLGDGGAGSGGEGQGIYGRRSDFQYGIPGTPIYSGSTYEKGLAIFKLWATLPGVYDVEFRTESPNPYLEVIGDSITSTFNGIIKLKDGVSYAPLGETIVVRAYQPTGPNVKQLVARATFIVTSLYKRDYPGWEGAVTGVHYIGVSDISAYTIVDSISVNYTGNSVDPIVSVSDGGNGFTIGSARHTATSAIRIREYEHSNGATPYIFGSQRNKGPYVLEEGGHTRLLLVAPFEVVAVEYCFIEKTETGHTLHSSTWFYEEQCNNWLAPTQFTYGFSDVVQMMAVDNNDLYPPARVYPSIVNYGGSISDLSNVLIYTSESNTVICSDGTTTLSENVPADIIEDN